MQVEMVDNPVSFWEEKEAQINENFIEAILPFSEQKNYEKNDPILMNGEDSRCIYYVKKGRVEVSHDMNDTKIALTLIGTGEFFGEVGFFDGMTRVRDIRATELSTICFFDGNSLRKMEDIDPRLYGNFIYSIINRICVKFRRVLADQEPLTVYAAGLSSGGHSFEKSLPIPQHSFDRKQWKIISGIVEEFKSQFYNISYILQEDTDEEIPPDIKNRCHDFLDRFNNQLQDLQESFYDTELFEVMWGYIFKEIFPYFMRSRFAERVYYKPRGFAGDFFMIEMIYNNESHGDGKIGTIVDNWCLNTAAAKAVRGRRQLLAKQIERSCSKRLDTQSTIDIMNLGCGPSRELFDFLKTCEYSEKIEATCVDIDSGALEYLANNINTFPHEASIRLMHDNVIKWSLGRVNHRYDLQDIIYSAGLTDYLDRRLFLTLINRCYEYLKPGGELIIGNFTPKNPNIAFMEHLLHWKLIHRDRKQLEDTFSKTLFGKNLEFMIEDEGVNIFVIAKKET